jgi:hypothetical protein
MPGNSFEDFQLVPFDIETKKIDLSSPNGQQDGIKRETLDGYHVRIDAWNSRLLQCFHFTLNVTKASVLLRLKLDLHVHYSLDIVFDLI